MFSNPPVPITSVSCLKFFTGPQFTYTQCFSSASSNFTLTSKTNDEKATSVGTCLGTGVTTSVCSHNRTTAAQTGGGSLHVLLGKEPSCPQTAQCRDHLLAFLQPDPRAGVGSEAASSPHSAPLFIYLKKFFLY